ncbi:hypothetical protein J2Z22_004047 [Paenibacillus forsythiae]|uniref:Uncharacterized protein n=1 Tax=Paenibacillus forsythiae TaxID=365616 RepID=A0ABU3HCB3_9BACL|nr:hypothetical protein [Paenibacillus forsythiae]
MREKLKKRVASSWSITAVVLRIQEDKSKAPQEYPLAYHYPEKSKLDSLNNVPFKEGFFTNTVGTGTYVPIPGTNRAVSIDFGMKLFTDATFMAGVTLLFGYWVLFAVWASMNVYYRGHGKVVWVILFLLFNVLGYGLYKTAVKMNKLQRRLHRFA